MTTVEMRGESRERESGPDCDRAAVRCVDHAQCQSIHGIAARQRHIVVVNAMKCAWHSRRVDRIGWGWER